MIPRHGIMVELRSRLLLPRDAPEAARALAEAEALRRAAVERVAVAAPADWLERRPQLGRDVFARGRASDTDAEGRGSNADLDDAGQCYTGNDWLDGPPEGLPDYASNARIDPVADITELLRGCLAALRLPAAVEAAMAEAAWRAPSPPLWRLPDAMARIVALLGKRPAGGTLDAFLPPPLAATCCAAPPSRAPCSAASSWPATALPRWSRTSPGSRSTCGWPRPPRHHQVGRQTAWGRPRLPRATRPNRHGMVPHWR